VRLERTFDMVERILSEGILATALEPTTLFPITKGNFNEFQYYSLKSPYA